MVHRAEDGDSLWSDVRRAVTASSRSAGDIEGRGSSCSSIGGEDDGSSSANASGVTAQFGGLEEPECKTVYLAAKAGQVRNFVPYYMLFLNCWQATPCKRGHCCTHTLSHTQALSLFNPLPWRSLTVSPSLSASVCLAPANMFNTVCTLSNL